MTTNYTCIDLFSGLGGFSSAFEEHDEWEVLTVDLDEKFNPDIQEDIINLRPQDLPKAKVILASPPCSAFSMAASGTHINEDGNPVSDWGSISLLIVHHTVGLIKGSDPDFWFLENPMGGMRKQLGPPDAHIWWCQYGSGRAKPTDLWGRIPPSFDARRCRNDSDSCHHEKAPRGSDSGTQSSNLGKSRRAEIPYGLSEQILKSVENPDVENNTIKKW